jgi:hypothetical protein
MAPETTSPSQSPPSAVPSSFPSLLSLASAELHAQSADLSACRAQAESAKLGKAIKANLKGLGYVG